MFKCNDCDEFFEEAESGDIPTYVPYGSTQVIYCYNAVCPNCGSEDFEEISGEEYEELRTI